MLKRVNNTIGRMMIAGDTKTWDYGFMESLVTQLEKGSTLSDRQMTYLQQIESRFSDEALAAIADWAGSWDDEKESKFQIALMYYKQTGYYSGLVTKYLGPDSKRNSSNPSEKEYNKLVNNKYASAVIRNLSAPPKFPVGSVATFRDTYAVNGSLRSFRGTTCVILKYGGAEKVTSHAKGASPVLVLPVGKAEPVWAEERDLKKAKKR